MEFIGLGILENDLSHLLRGLQRFFLYLECNSNIDGLILNENFNLNQNIFQYHKEKVTRLYSNFLYNSDFFCRKALFYSETGFDFSHLRKKYPKHLIWMDCPTICLLDDDTFSEYDSNSLPTGVMRIAPDIGTQFINTFQNIFAKSSLDIFSQSPLKEIFTENPTTIAFDNAIRFLGNRKSENKTSVSDKKKLPRHVDELPCPDCGDCISVSLQFGGLHGLVDKIKKEKKNREKPGTFGERFRRNMEYYFEDHSRHLVHADTKRDLIWTLKEYLPILTEKRTPGRHARKKTLK